MNRLLIPVLVALVLAGCNHGTSPDSATSQVTLQILDYDGIQRLIAGHRGQVVVLDAWSTSCPPCIRDFHQLVELQRRHDPRQVACVSLSFDYEGLGRPEDQRPKVLEFLQKQGASFDNVLGAEESESLYKKFELGSIPAVFVYDRDGKLHKRFGSGSSDDATSTYNQVEQLVNELLPHDNSQ